MSYRLRPQPPSHNYCQSQRDYECTSPTSFSHYVILFFPSSIMTLFNFLSPISNPKPYTLTQQIFPKMFVFCSSQFSQLRGQKLHSLSLLTNQAGLYCFHSHSIVGLFINSHHLYCCVAHFAPCARILPLNWSIEHQTFIKTP